MKALLIGGGREAVLRFQVVQLFAERRWIVRGGGIVKGEWISRKKLRVAKV